MKVTLPKQCNDWKILEEEGFKVIASSNELSFIVSMPEDWSVSKLDYSEYDRFLQVCYLTEGEFIRGRILYQYDHSYKLIHTSLHVYPNRYEGHVFWEGRNGLRLGMLTLRDLYKDQYRHIGNIYGIIVNNNFGLLINGNFYTLKDDEVIYLEKYDIDTFINMTEVNGIYKIQMEELSNRVFPILYELAKKRYSET